MSDIQHFFKPIDLDTDSFRENQLIHFASTHTSKTNFPELENIDMAIIGVCEDRRAYSNIGCALAPDKVRTYLYSLYPGNYKPRIADLGNIQAGHDVEDTYYALKSTVDYLIRKIVEPEQRTAKALQQKSLSPDVSCSTRIVNPTPSEIIAQPSSVMQNERKSLPSLPADDGVSWAG